MEVAHELEEVGVRLHKNRLEAILHEMTMPVVAAIEGGGVPAQQAMHQLRQAARARAHQKVDVIRHEVAEHLAAGTRLVWVVDLQIRRISVYRSAHDLRVLGEGDELSGEDVLPGLRFPVWRCFSPR